MGDVKTLLGNPISHLQHTPSYVRTAEELLQDVDELHVACMQLQALLAQRVYEVEVRGVELEASSTKRYLAERLQLKQATAGRLLDLGHTLSARPALAEAVQAGTVNVELVPIIADAVQTIDGVAPGHTLDQAERFLIGQVTRGLSPTQLAQCGEAILHHVAPDLADGFDEDRRRREEEKPTGGVSSASARPYTDPIESTAGWTSKPPPGCTPPWTRWPGAARRRMGWLMSGPGRNATPTP